MKKLIAILTLVFAFTILSKAQTGGAPGSTDHPSGGAQAGTGDQASAPKAQKKSAGSTTLTGCLSGPNDEGVYELKSGKKEVEVGGLDDLSKHVGHQVRLHGAWAKSGAEIGEKEGSEASEAKEKGEKGEKSEKAERHFKVASIDHVSGTCPAGAAEKGEHHQSPASQPSSTPKM
jgi:hypothetical protein